MKLLVCFSPDTSRTVVARYLYFIRNTYTVLHPWNTKCIFSEKFCDVAKSVHLHTWFNHAIIQLKFSDTSNVAVQFVSKYHLFLKTFERKTGIQAIIFKETSDSESPCKIDKLSSEGNILRSR